MKKSYKIEATNIHGCMIPDFIGRRFSTMKEALSAFDANYHRKGFRIMIYLSDGINEPTLARIVKSSFR